MFVHSIQLDMFRWKAWEGFSLKKERISAAEPVVTTGRTDSFTIYKCCLRAAGRQKFSCLKAASGEKLQFGTNKVARSEANVCQNGEWTNESARPKAFKHVESLIPKV
jgi:hypothetical protein